MCWPCHAWLNSIRRPAALTTLHSQVLHLARLASLVAVQVDCRPHDGFSFMVRLAERAAEDSRLAAALMAESVLETVLDQIAKQARGGTYDGIDQVRRLRRLVILVACLDTYRADS